MPSARLVAFDNFGRHYLASKTGQEPVLYVSEESHYSNMRLAELQQLEVRLIPTDEMGRMVPEELEKALDPERPALIVYSMGTTFKGGIDEMPHERLTGAAATIQV